MRELSIQELGFVSGGRRSGNTASNGSVIGGNGGAITQVTGNASAGLVTGSGNSSITNTNVNTSGTALGLSLSL